MSDISGERITRIERICVDSPRPRDIGFNSRKFLSGNHRLRRGRQERGLRGAYRARDGSRIGQEQLGNDQIRDAISDSMILNIRSDRR